VPQRLDLGPTVRRAAFALDTGMCRRFLRVLDYVETRHWNIDPDMFQIDLGRVASLKPLFAPAPEGQAPALISFTYDELFALETALLAADTYSHRHNEPPVWGVTDDELAGLQTWLTRSMRWFITPVKEDL
jgi:hypothetical protein